MLNIVCKALGSVLVLGCSIAVGFGYAQSLMQKRDCLKLMIRYWRAFAMILESSGDEPSQIAAELGRSLEFLHFPFAVELRSQAISRPDFGAVLCCVVEDLPDLSSTVKEILLPLGEVIGRSSMENQIRVLQNAVSSLQREQEFWEETTQKRGGLARRLGILGGVLLVIILL